MAEIEAVPPNGFMTVSTFSGCGGSCLGMRMAGFRVAWASEFIPAAQDTYRANHPGVILDTRDIRQVQPADILGAIGLVAGDLDVFEGSPPCASFSTAGKREAGWGQVKPYSDSKQRTDDLFHEYCRLIEGIRPRIFLAENVSGLVKGTAKGYFLEILARMKAAGYRVEARLLDASWLGVPQARQRIFFQGVREDLGAAPAWPKPLPYRYTVRDALAYVIAQGDNGGFGGGSMRPADQPNPTLGESPASGNGRFPPSRVIADPEILLQRGVSGKLTVTGPGDPAPSVMADGMGNGCYRSGEVAIRVIAGLGTQVADQPAPTVPQHGRRYTHSALGLAGAGDGLTRDPETGEDITIGRYAIGREWKRLRQGSSSDKYPSLVRPDPGTPLPTVSTFANSGCFATAGVTHWAECRKLTLGELRRLGGFPDDFVLSGSYAQRWERIGRAVPPVMMYHLAAAVRDGVLVPLREQGRI